MSLAALLRVPGGGRWLELAKRPQCIMNYHFSATPKPVHVIMAACSGKAGHLQEQFDDTEIRERLLDADVPLQQKMATYSNLVWQHHHQRAVTFSEGNDLVCAEDQEALRRCQMDSATLYAKVFVEESWPLLVKRVVQVTTKICFQTEAFQDTADYNGLNDAECQFCNIDFKSGGGLGHACFYCTKVKYCLHEAFTNFGPRSEVQIALDDFQSWKTYFEKFKHNPIHERAAGTIAIQIRMAYLTEVISEYGEEHFEHNLPHQRITENSENSFEARTWIKDYWASVRPLHRKLLKKTFWAAPEDVLRAPSEARVLELYASSSAIQKAREKHNLAFSSKRVSKLNSRNVCDMNSLKL